ncbi:MAG: DUF2127 domain-containing protein [Candidatus Saccharimonas sp.]
MERLEQIRNNKWYERIYKVGVGIKGFDGTVELIAGIWLMVAPEAFRELLEHWHSAALGWGNSFGVLLGHGIQRVHEEMYGGVLVFAIIFLLSHGIIKLVLVYALLKEILWTYPYALAILGVFVIAQIVAVILRPGIGMALLLLLNLLIMAIVWGEWQKLKTEISQRTNERQLSIKAK